MKRYILLVVGVLSYLSTQAQILEPVKWSYAAKKTTANIAVVFIKATIDAGWHIYSTKQKDGGPIKTSFAFGSSTDYELIGDITEPKPIIKHEEAFKMDVHYFQHSVVFQQKIKLINRITTIHGTIHFMVCNDQKCLPPDDLSFDIPLK